MSSVIARKNDKAIYVTMDNLDCFVPTNDEFCKLVNFSVFEKSIFSSGSRNDVIKVNLFRNNSVARGIKILFNLRHLRAFIRKLIPARIVSGLKLKTLRISPAMEKPHWSQTPAVLPGHSEKRVESAIIKFVTQHSFLN